MEGHGELRYSSVNPSGNFARMIFPATSISWQIARANGTRFSRPSAARPAAAARCRTPKRPRPHQGADPCRSSHTAQPIRSACENSPSSGLARSASGNQNVGALPDLGVGDRIDALELEHRPAVVMPDALDASHAAERALLELDFAQTFGAARLRAVNFCRKLAAPAARSPQAADDYPVFSIRRRTPVIPESPA